MSAPNTQNNSIIGLRVSDRTFYCHRSTLTNNSESGSYFKRRFDTSIPSDQNPFAQDSANYIDSNGIQIFFIERNGRLFEYVLQYLTRLTLHLPPFSENQELWKDLRLEAEFFGLDGLQDLLSVTHSCPYYDDADDDALASGGIFYWLGTGRGKEDHPDYINPLKVRGRNSNRETSLLEVYIGFIEETKHFFRDYSVDKKSFNLLQHRKKIDVSDRNLTPIDGNTPLWMKSPSARHPLSVPLGLAPPALGNVPPMPRIIKFGSILVRPTHVSIRIPFNKLLEDPPVVNLEVSVDGSSWDRFRLILLPHETSPETATAIATETATETSLKKDAQHEIDSIFADPKAPMLQSMNRLIDVAERFLRRTWTVEPVPKEYYKYFRFVGANGGSTDLLGVALEMFGDVHEG